MNRRILLVDDNESIHEDFQSILCPRSRGSDALREAKAALLGSPATGGDIETFELTSAYQGEQAVELARQHVAAGEPFATAFVDIRMPPGIDGAETLERLWEVDPELQAVICTAYSDHSWNSVLQRFGDTDRLLVLRKPFDNIEVWQLASALTRKWQLERESASRMRQLADLVEERTIDIQRAHDKLLSTNKELQAAKAAAEEASKAKSAFLANVSHEIRTPMTAILGFTDVLLSDGDITLAPKERVHAINTIRRNGSQLVQMINDLLDLSKIEANQMQVELTACSPIEIAAGVVELMKVRANEKDLSLDVEVDGEIPELIESDPTRLRQILINLVGNAVKFTEEGGIRIVLSAENDADSKLTIVFKVIDSGIGIEPEVAERLFQPFTQADVSTTRKYGGTGLGLSISKQLAESLGGDIRLNAASGKGTEFTVTIRADHVEGTKMVRQQKMKAKVDRPLPTVSDDTRLRGRVLLVEDGIDNQRLFSLLLKKAGADVTVSENGKIGCVEVAAAEASGRPFDLILMDMQMPVLDGYEATRLLRSQGCDVPIVATTAHAMTGDRDECMAAGCNDYLTKPLNREQLLGMVARYLSIEEGADSDAAEPETNSCVSPAAEPAVC